MPTDRSYVDRIASLAGRDLFDDELSHRTEHSIEFQVVFLQYLLGGRRDFSIVPILVGSFHDLMERGVDPIDDPEVSRFIRGAAGRRVVERQAGRLHRGHRPVPRRARVRRPEPGRSRASGAGPRRSTARCSTGPRPATPAAGSARPRRWATASGSAAWPRPTQCCMRSGPAQGRLLKYKQALDDRRTCCVSFASMVFHAAEPSSTTTEAHVATHCLTSAAAPDAADLRTASPALPGPGRFSRGSRRATTTRPRSAAGTVPVTG